MCLNAQFIVPTVYLYQGEYLVESMWLEGKRTMLKKASWSRKDMTFWYVIATELSGISGSGPSIRWSSQYKQRVRSLTRYY